MEMKAHCAYDQSISWRSAINFDENSKLKAANWPKSIAAAKSYVRAASAGVIVNYRKKAFGDWQTHTHGNRIISSWM